MIQSKLKLISLLVIFPLTYGSNKLHIISNFKVQDWQHVVKSAKQIENKKVYNVFEKLNKKLYLKHLQVYEKASLYVKFVYK